MKEDGSSVPQPLRESLNTLHGCEYEPSYEEQYWYNPGSELSRIYNEILQSDDEDVEIENASRDIKQQLETFLVCLSN